MSAITIFLMFVVVALLIIDVMFYQTYWHRYAERYGYVDYSAGAGFYIFWKLEMNE